MAAPTCRHPWQVWVLLGDQLAWMRPGGLSCWWDAAADTAWGQGPSELSGALSQRGLGVPGTQGRGGHIQSSSLPAVSRGTLLLPECGEGATEGADDGSVRLNRQLVL